jgi:hypothetical protein
MRGHHNQVHIFLLRHAQDVLGRGTFSHHEFDLCVGAEELLPYEGEFRMGHSVRMIPKWLG